MAVRIRAAISAGIRPMAMVFHEQPNEPWTDGDFRLLEAYQMLEDETCSHCGQPLWLCRSEDVEWRVQSSTCYADAALERWRDSKTDSNGKSTVSPGEHPYAIPYVLEFDENGKRKEVFDRLPSRQQFFEPDQVE